jgi:hypothetical protein
MTWLRPPEADTLDAKADGSLAMPPSTGHLFRLVPPLERNLGAQRCAVKVKVDPKFRSCSHDADLCRSAAGR